MPAPRAGWNCRWLPARLTELASHSELHHGSADGQRRGPLDDRCGGPAARRRRRVGSSAAARPCRSVAGVEDRLMARRAAMLDRLIVDLRSATRSLRARPAIPVAAILTTALAVGINLAMVGLIDRALLSPPALVVAPDRVFTIGFEIAGPSGETGLVATTSFQRFTAIRSALPEVTPAAWTAAGTSVVVEHQRFVVTATAVTSSYFDMLGVGAQRGRTLTTGDERPPAGDAVAVLSHSLWQRAFGGDEDVLGRRIKLGGLEIDVVGVMP